MSSSPAPRSAISGSLLTGFATVKPETIDMHAPMYVCVGCAWVAEVFVRVAVARTYVATRWSSFASFGDHRALWAPAASLPFSPLLLMSISVPAAGEKNMGLCVAKARFTA